MNEPNKWVRYTMEESAALIKLASERSVDQSRCSR